MDNSFASDPTPAHVETIFVDPSPLGGSTATLVWEVAPGIERKHALRNKAGSPLLSDEQVGRILRMWSMPDTRIIDRRPRPAGYVRVYTGADVLPAC